MYGYVHVRAAENNLCPLLTTPEAEGFVGGFLVDFSWEDVGADSYVLVRAFEDPEFVDPIETPTESTSLTEVDVSFSGLHYWYVDTVVNGVRSNCVSGARSFTVTVG